MKHEYNKLKCYRNTIRMIFAVSLLVLYALCGNTHAIAKADVEHIKSKDLKVIDEAFLHGYTHNVVTEQVGDKKLPTLTIQCTNNNLHLSDENLSADRKFFSVWTRDLYWGFLGWAQAGDDRVLDIMKSSIRLLIIAKDKNQALGQSKTWPLNDERFYVPQAYCTGLAIAMDFYPWCSESQVDFLLFIKKYYDLSGDKQFIEEIWNDVVYVTKTVELLDTNGNSLPDAIYGSYDYMGVGLDSEESLMCAKTSLAYSSVAELARILGKEGYAERLGKLAVKVKETMNKPIEEGGLWKKEGEAGGYYVNMRKITKGNERINEQFIPYDNIVPMWCGMTSPEQDKAIFAKLDTGFAKYYDLNYGPMYCAPAAKNEKSVMDSSSVTWLAFLDTYLRCKKGHATNRSKIFDMLIEHARDAGGIPFSEGAGIYGDLTGGAGRCWDNGNFFHMLISGIYGIAKSKDGVLISSPVKMDTMPLTELKNFCWRKAVYDFKWAGKGKAIKNVFMDGKEISGKSGVYALTSDIGKHNVEINLWKE